MPAVASHRIDLEDVIVTTLLVVLLVGMTVATLAALAWALVAATDRLRETVDRLLAVRGAVEPHLDELRAEADRARAHAERIRTTPLRPERDAASERRPT